MIKNKRGLSTVVTTLIIILLVLVAIGIIWIVVRGVMEKGVENIDYATECLYVDIKATSVDCNISGTDGDCQVTLRRTATGEHIDGVKMIFYNATESTSIFDSRTNDGGGLTDGIDPLTTVTTGTIDTNITSANKVEVTAYFLDQQGLDQVCAQTNPFSFS